MFFRYCVGNRSSSTKIRALFRGEVGNYPALALGLASELVLTGLEGIEYSDGRFIVLQSGYNHMLQCLLIF